MSKNAPTPGAGQWANAPVVFVLAQVRFPAQPEGFTERLQLAVSKLRENDFLPAQPVPVMDVKIEVDQGGVPKQTVTQTGTGYNIARNDGRMVVRIEPSSLTLAVNEYRDSNHLIGEWLPMVACLRQARLKGKVTRLGLRYVDFVAPAEGKLPEDYVNAPWNQSTTPHFVGAIVPPGMFVCLHDIEFTKGRMRVQYMRGFGKPSLPADLLGLLEPRTVPDDASRPTAVIDTDRWMEESWEPSGEQISNDFKRMHQDLSNAFKAMVTPMARAQWGDPTINGDDK
jgi:uncharacterized protein (TIGR04255 family)